MDTPDTNYPAGNAGRREVRRATPEHGAETGKTYEINVEKLVYGGRGLGRLEGQVVLAPFVLPGETVRVKVRHARPGMLEADLVEVLTPSERRVEPGCPYFFDCGGCQYQHASHGQQLQLKAEILREVLRRGGKIEAPEEIRVVSGEPWQYRNRSQFHLSRGRIGYLAMGSHRLVPVEKCPISSPRLNDTLRTLWEMLRDPRFPKFVKSMEVFTNESEVQLNIRESDRPVARKFFEWAAERIPGAEAGALDYATARYTYRVSHGSFFQVNRFLVDALIDVALEGAEGETALDLYAGVGLFALPLARRFGRVIAVESGASAVRDLEFNAARAGVPVEAVKSSAEVYLPGLGEAPGFVLADPPRAGLGKSVTRELIRLRPPKLCIVSCDPSTLARDLSALLAAGYRLEKLTLVDLFPQTFHIESVAELTLAA